MLEGLSEDTKNFYSSTYIKRLKNPTALEFMRECVSSHQPCIIEGLLSDWKCIDKWETSQGFLDSAPGNVDVNFTPDGRADSINQDGLFMTPIEMNVKTSLFMAMLENPYENDAVPYLSAQNDNLRDRMPELLKDCSTSLSLADECFGISPEAVNLWVGDERSVSSTHKDFFENMYCVVRGCKTFTLFPPTDVAFLPTGLFSSRTYSYTGHHDHDNKNDGKKNECKVQSDDNKRPQKIELIVTDRKERIKQEQEEQDGDVRDDDSSIQWIPLDPDDPNANSKHHLLHLASPLRVQVQAGEVLYLPALWLHRVSQTCLTIAVNFWYDMRFDLRYVLLQTAQRLLTEQQAVQDNDEK